MSQHIIGNGNGYPSRSRLELGKAEGTMPRQSNNASTAPIRVARAPQHHPQSESLRLSPLAKRNPWLDDAYVSPQETYYLSHHFERGVAKRGFGGAAAALGVGGAVAVGLTGTLAITALGIPIGALVISTAGVAALAFIGIGLLLLHQGVRERFQYQANQHPEQSLLRRVRQEQIDACLAAQRLPPPYQAVVDVCLLKYMQDSIPAGVTLHNYQPENKVAWDKLIRETRATFAGYLRSRLKFVGTALTPSQAKRELEQFSARHRQSQANKVAQSACIDIDQARQEFVTTYQDLVEMAKRMLTQFAAAPPSNARSQKLTGDDLHALQSRQDEIDMQMDVCCKWLKKIADLQERQHGATVIDREQAAPGYMLLNAFRDAANQLGGIEFTRQIKDAAQDQISQLVSYLAREKQYHQVKTQAMGESRAAVDPSPRNGHTQPSHSHDDSSLHFANRRFEVGLLLRSTLFDLLKFSESSAYYAPLPPEDFSSGTESGDDADDEWTVAGDPYADTPVVGSPRDDGAPHQL